MIAQVINKSSLTLYSNVKGKDKGKVVPLQSRCDPEGG